MRGFPLAPLILIRQRRVDVALTEVGRRRAEVQRCEQARIDAAEKVDATLAERAGNQARILVETEMLALHRAEQRVAMLGERAERERQTLRQADDALAAAHEELRRAQGVYRLQQRKLDAIVEQRERWQQERRRETARRDELAIEELLAGRHGR